MPRKFGHGKTPRTDTMWSPGNLLRDVPSVQAEIHINVFNKYHFLFLKHRTH